MSTRTNGGCYPSQTKRTQTGEQQPDRQTSFEAEFHLLLNPNNPSGAAFLAFIERKLRQFHLDGSCSSAEILSETYIRAIKLIKIRGVEILNLPAWVRTTAHNIIRERYRQQRRFMQLEENYLPEVDRSAADDSDLDGDFNIMGVAFQMLTPIEQEILSLKIVEELAWNEIRQLLAHEGRSHTEQALRKRKERIVKKLYGIFKQLKCQLEHHNLAKKVLITKNF